MGPREVIDFLIGRALEALVQRVEEAEDDGTLREPLEDYASAVASEVAMANANEVLISALAIYLKHSFDPAVVDPSAPDYREALLRETRSGVRELIEEELAKPVVAYRLAVREGKRPRPAGFEAFESSVDDAVHELDLKPD